MKVVFPLLITSSFFISCSHVKTQEEKPDNIPAAQIDTPHNKSYNEILDGIKTIRINFIKEYNDPAHNRSLLRQQTTDFWVNAIGNDLYQQWKSTPWDFNGTTRKPKKGKIACGYFVTTLLLDMGYKLDRVKLSTCDALTMMKSLTSSKSIKNLSYLRYNDFNQQIKAHGKGVFIIGLDYHVGFLVNDGVETWFLHSNYIRKTGVIKELISESIALKQSTSRFVTCITCDSGFLYRWLYK